MKRAKHQGESHICCPACITRAESNRFPWEHDYLTVFARKGADTEYTAHHAAAMTKQYRAQVKKNAPKWTDADGNPHY